MTELEIALLCALTKIYDNYITPLNTRIKCWKAKTNGDYFIVGMTIIEFTGEPTNIGFYIPINWWISFKLLELEKAPDYKIDDVINRLLKL